MHPSGPGKARPPLVQLARLGLWLLVALAGLEALWLALFAWADGSGRLLGWINRRPDRVVIDYRSISSLWPGLLEIDGLVVRGRTRRGIDWQVEVERARAQLALSPLLARHVVFRRAELAAVEVRSRTPPPAEDASPAAAPVVPLRPLSAPAAVRRAAPAAPPVPSPAGRWTFEFQLLEVEALRRIEVDGTELLGPARGEIAFAVDAASGEAALHPSWLELDAARVVRRGEEIGRRLTGRVELAIAPYRYREERGRALVPHASGRVRLAGELDDRQLVAELLRRIDWIEIEPGFAPFEGDLRFRRGRLLAGSRLVAPRGGRRVRLLDFEVAGSNALSLAVDGAGARWEVRFERFVLRRAGLAGPLLQGQGLALVGSTPRPDLADLPAHGTVALELGEAHLPDLGFLREWLPPGVGIERLAGTAQVAGRLGARVATRVPEGRIELRFESLAATWRGHELTGGAKVDLEVRGGDLAARRLEVGGTRLELKGFRAPTLLPAPPEGKGAGAADPGWWMQALFEPGEVRLGPPLAVDGRFAVRLRDTRPLLAIFEARRDLPGWGERLLSRQDVSARGAFRAAPGRVELDEFETDLLGGHLFARLRFLDTRRTGKLLLAWDRLAVGLGFDGEQRDLRVRGARAWFGEPFESAPAVGEAADD